MGKGTRTRRVTRSSMPTIPAAPPAPSIPSATLHPHKFRSFLAQSCRFPNFGEPGITQFVEMAYGTVPIEMMVHRDPNGILRAIFSYFPFDMPPRQLAGEFLVFVDPSWQRQGLATEMFEIADARFGIDLSAQSYTPDGRRFAEAMALRRGYIAKRRFTANASGLVELLP
jgi:GNAT superfamily N-acetyltransferase